MHIASVKSAGGSLNPQAGTGMALQGDAREFAELLNCLAADPGKNTPQSPQSAALPEAPDRVEGHEKPAESQVAEAADAIRDHQADEAADEPAEAFAWPDALTAAAAWFAPLSPPISNPDLSAAEITAISRSMAQEVALLQGQETVEFQAEPQALNGLTVRLTRQSGTGEIRVTLIASNPDMARLMKVHLDRMARSLQRQGVRLRDLSVVQAGDDETGQGWSSQGLLPVNDRPRRR